ncbi:DNA polymerase III chi subunit, HolC [mine drainage metagenome]|uniref:DNA polymerase III chi subunit, HolC n=1 Tax=mine drainage metagenome TaxID=410659 RepID=T0YYF4_9ZZZZ
MPHEWLRAARPGAPRRRPSCSALSLQTPRLDVLINLGLSAEPPSFLERIARVVEIIDGEPSRRDAGRARFKAYRQTGLSPDTHTLQAS